MEKQKLENQEIKEGEMEKVAGGYDVKVDYAEVDDGPPELIETLFVNDEELKLIKEAGGLRSDGSISKEDLPKLTVSLSLAKMFGDKRITNDGKNEIKVV